MMSESQGGICAICKKPPQQNKRLAVDHCHTTGDIRGLLCDLCNRGLGFFQDDIERIAIAIVYLGNSRKIK